jgi:type I restriction enzyme S subunit
VISQSRRLFALRKERIRAGDEQLTASQKYGVIYQKKFMELEDQRVVQVLLDAEILKHVEPNDFVISMRSFQGGIELCQDRGCISSAYVMLIPGEHIDVQFFKYVFKSSTYIQALQSTTNLVRDGQALRFENFALVPLPRVPKDEQTAIAAFLDRETAKIDGLVAEQRRLIELLKEKRQAVISHAVTKGLNPNAPMKPSGIEWLGDVPEHWSVVALKRIAEIQTGIAKGKDYGPEETIAVPYLRVANVQDGYLDLESITTIQIPASDVERYRLRSGDVLMNEGGDYDKLGRGCVWHGQIDPCIHQNHVFAVRPHGASPEWISAIIGSQYAQFYFMILSKQSTNLASISSTNLMELPVVVPSGTDQEAILKFIVGTSSSFDTLTTEAERAIGLLQERRTALISAAVTGKIDVRELAHVEAA